MGGKPPNTFEVHMRLMDYIVITVILIVSIYFNNLHIKNETELQADRLLAANLVTAQEITKRIDTYHIMVSGGYKNYRAYKQSLKQAKINRGPDVPGGL